MATPETTKRPFYLTPDLLRQLMEHCDFADDDPDHFVHDAVIMLLDMELQKEGLDDVGP